MFKYIDCYGNFYFLSLNLRKIYNINLKFIHNFIIYYRSNSRFSGGVQKNRSLLNFSTRKIYKQKGTGKSRAGSLSSPLRRKGARAFPGIFFENFLCKINKRTFKFVIFIIFSILISNNRFYLLDDFFFIKVSTKYFINKIKSLGFFNFIILTFKVNLKFFLSQRNYYLSFITNLFNLNPLLLIKYDKVLLFTSSLNYFF